MGARSAGKVKQTPNRTMAALPAIIYTARYFMGTLIPLQTMRRQNQYTFCRDMQILFQHKSVQKLYIRAGQNMFPLFRPGQMAHHGIQKSNILHDGPPNRCRLFPRRKDQKQKQQERQ